MAAYTEVETDRAGLIALKCPECKNVIKKRRDSFLPGAHTLICVLCGHVDSEVELQSGEVRQVRPEDHRQPGDFKRTA